MNKKRCLVLTLVILILFLSSLVSASGIGAPQFKILTIKKLGQQPYDVVSDSNKI